MSTSTLDVRMAHLEGSYEQIDKRLGTMERRLDSIERKIETQFYWLLGVILAGIAAGHLWR